MKKIVTPFRVGLLVIVSGAILFGFLSFVRKGGMSDRESMRVTAYFRDASGLGPKSRVQIAGIAVGEVGKIELEGTRAKVHLKIRRDVNLRQDAALTKRSESLLGDYLLDLVPGTDAAEPMPDDGQIKKVIDSQGMEQLFSTLNTITGDIQAVTASLREVLGGDKGVGSLKAIVENMVRLSEAIDTTVRASSSRLDQILQNVEVVSGDVRAITTGEGADIRRIVQNIEKITNDTKDVMASVKGIVGDNEGDLKDTAASLKQTLKRVDNVLADAETFTKRIKEGQGLVGELISDDKLGQKVAETVDDVADLASKITSLQLEASVRSDYLVTQGQAKTALAVRLIPRPDKYYLIELVDDPRGSVETVVVQNNPPSQGDPVVQRQTITREGIKFSAQFAKRYSYLTLRVGIIENTGGVGADFSLPIKFFWYSKWIEDALVVRVDAFNFSVESLTYPRLRAQLRISPYDHVFLTVGIDDILNRPNRDVTTNRLITGRDFFVGAGIYFTDADLKALLPIVPIPK